MSASLITSGSSDSAPAPKALVIGASGLLGRAITENFLKRGYFVTGTYHKNAQRLQAMRDTWRDNFHAIPCDLKNPEKGALQIQVPVETADILVCAIGPKRRGLALTTSCHIMNDILQQAVTRQTEIARQVLRPMMRRKSSGRIILLGSYAGNHGLPGQAAYAAAMAALEGWVKSVAGEVGPFGITVNLLAPGAIEEPASETKEFYSAAEEEAVKKIIGSGRLGQPNEIAAVVGFLSSAEASYVNGAIIAVDGAARF